jgi:hypothetical protein
VKDIRTYILALMALILLSALIYDFYVLYPYSYFLVTNWITGREWDTVLAAIIALTGAGWTVTHLRKQNSIQQQQIELQRLQFNEDKKQKTLLAQSQLKDLVIRLMDYPDAVFIMLYNNKDTSGKELVGQIPDYPAPLFIELKKLSVYLTPNVIKFVLEISEYSYHLKHRLEEFRKAYTDIDKFEDSPTLRIAASLKSSLHKLDCYLKWPENYQNSFQFTNPRLTSDNPAELMHAISGYYVIKNIREHASINAYLFKLLLKDFPHLQNNT